MLGTPKHLLRGLIAAGLAPWWGTSSHLVHASSGDDAGLAADLGRLTNETLFWGPYKPNLYFGVRPRVPDGLWTGLMWAKFSDADDLQREMRYTCEQNEGIHGYGWDEYDARTGGVQTIHDEANMIDITTSFVKLPSKGKAGSWAARIKGVPSKNAPKNHVTLLHFYIAQDGNGHAQVDRSTSKGDRFGFTTDLTISGSSDTMGDYKVRVTKGNVKHPVTNHMIMKPRRREDHMVVQSLEVPENMRWHAKHVTYYQIREPIDWVKDNVPDGDYPPPWLMYALEHRPGAGNVHIVQRTFKGEWEFDVIFASADEIADISEETVTKAIEKTKQGFTERFAEVFKFKAPFDASEYLRFGKSMFSNLIGGIGYFNGKHLVDRSYAPEYDEDEEGFWVEAAAARARKQQKLEGPYELFTSIPSRPFFPRGFLWDEGFHLLPIADWDLDLALEIVQSWLNLMDDDGWIGREQILGEEARSKVPEEFQVQYPHYANPPTLFLVVDSLIDRLRKQANTSATHGDSIPLRTAYVDNPTLGMNLLRELYPQLRKYYDWMRRTQAGDIKSYEREAFSTREGYRWRGRTETHILTSGLDDYPRAQPPHPGELHVDLLSWVGLMTRSLINVAEILGLDEDTTELRGTLHAIKQNLNDLHWSEKEGCFCDATIDAYEENSLVCHKGYVSLFPFILGMVDADDPKMEKVLDLISDEDHLWSNHGLRSLSKSDPLYGTAENYWRSPVWMNINYLALSALENLARHKGTYHKRAAELHAQLRQNLVSTVHKSWELTGFAWEQYNPDTGNGQRTQHFTGWTSLVVKMMTMEEIHVDGHTHESAQQSPLVDEGSATDENPDSVPDADAESAEPPSAGDEGGDSNADTGAGSESAEEKPVQREEDEDHIEL